MPMNRALSTLFAMVARRFETVLMFFLVLFGAAAVWIMLVSPDYEARATLLAKFGREHTLRSYEAGDGLVPINYAQDQIVNSAIEIMRSDIVAAKVVNQFGAEFIYPGITEVSGVKRLATNLGLAWDSLLSRLSGSPDSMSLQLGFSKGGSSGIDEDPERVAAERLRRNIRVAPAGRSSIIEARFSHPNPEVAALVLNGYLKTFQEMYHSLYSEDLVPILELEVARAHDQFLEVLQRVERFESENFTIVGDGQIERLLLRKSELERQSESLSECCAGTTAARAVEREIESLEASIRATNADRAQLRELVRENERAEAQLTASKNRLQAALNIQSLEGGGTSSVRMVSSAEPPARPAAPSRTIRLALAFVFASIASIAFGMALELIFRRYSSPEELGAAFDVPVLANIPYSKTSER